MRQAVINRLAADPAIDALVDGRIYGQIGDRGGISRNLTPEAFTVDGDLLLSLVVRMGVRVNDSERHPISLPGLHSRQSVFVEALCGVGVNPYDGIDQALRAVRRRLCLWEFPKPVNESQVKAWPETTFNHFGQPYIDEALQCPGNYVEVQALIREEI